MSVNRWVATVLHPAIYRIHRFSRLWRAVFDKDCLPAPLRCHTFYPGQSTWLSFPHEPESRKCILLEMDCSVIVALISPRTKTLSWLCHCPDLIGRLQNSSYEILIYQSPVHRRKTRLIVALKDSSDNYMNVQDTQYYRTQQHGNGSRSFAAK